MSAYHQIGLGSVERFQEFAPEFDSANSSEFTFNAAAISYCLIEIPVSETIRVLPPSLHPSIPGMAGFLHYQCSHDEFGAFDFIVIGVLCRSGVKPRLMTTGAFTNNTEVREQFSRTWGYPLRMANIRLKANYDRVRSSVEIEDALLLDFEVQNPVSLTGAGGSVRYPQCFNIARDKDLMKFVQVDVSFEFERVARGVPKINYCDSALIGNIDLGAAYPIAGTIVSANMTLHPVRYLADIVISAEDGGVTAVSKL